jgi:hypothetical protein
MHIAGSSIKERHESFLSIIMMYIVPFPKVQDHFPTGILFICIFGAEVLAFFCKAFEIRESLIRLGSLHEECFKARYAAARIIRSNEFANLRS